MHSRNQKVNAFETTMGLFLHSCRTPERVIDVLAHLRISISVNSIHNAVGSLFTESANCIQVLGQSLLIAWAYDNFDVDIKSTVPTIHNSGSSLRHLTSAILYPLQHNVQLDDLKTSENSGSNLRILSSIQMQSSRRCILGTHGKTSWPKCPKFTQT